MIDLAMLAAIREVQATGERQTWVSGARQWSHMASQMTCGVIRRARRLRTNSTACAAQDNLT